MRHCRATALDLRATGALMALISFAVYIMGDSAPGTARTFSWLGRLDVYGWFPVACGVVAVACSFFGDWVCRGHQVVMFGGGVWVAFLVAGFIDADASWAGGATIGIFAFLAFVSARAIERE